MSGRNGLRNENRRDFTHQPGGPCPRGLRRFLCLAALMALLTALETDGEDWHVYQREGVF